MTEPLRPMSLGEILDRTFQIYRARFWVFLGIAMLPLLALLAGTLVSHVLDGMLEQTTLQSSTKRYIENFGSGFSADLELAFLQLLSFSIFVYVASGEFLQERPTIRAAILSSWSRRKSWLGLAAAIWSICNGFPALVQHIPAVEHIRMSALFGFTHASAVARTWASAFLFFTLWWLGGFLLFVALVLSSPVWTLEKTNVKQSLRRGWRLAKVRYGRLFVACSLIATLKGVFCAASTYAFVAFYGIATRSFAWGHWQYATYMTAASAGEYAGLTLTAALYPIAITLFYYDQRIRLEGYDIERMMSAAGLHVPEVRGDAVVATAATEEQTA